MAQYTGDFRFQVDFNKYDYIMLRTLEDTSTTYNGHINAYQIGDFLRDVILPTSSDIHADQRLTIEFDYRKIITPVITDDGFLSSDEFQPKFSFDGYFNNPDNLFIEIMIEAGHAYTARYKITGQRLK